MLSQRLTSAFFLAVLAQAASAGTLYVDASLATGANDGSSWANAYQGSDGLQVALGAAASGDQVFVRTGTYLPSATGDRSDSFRFEDGVEIYGGFLGTESSPAERPPFGAAPTILSGDLAGNDPDFSENSFHVLRGNGADATALLDGFTVSGGNANTGGGNNDRGGGILCIASSSPTIRSCVFDGNGCTFGGGAGYINGSGSAPSFTDVTFSNNIGGSFGGAFDIASAGLVRYDRCLFEGNRASRAGALEIFNTTQVRVTNSTFRGNTATGASGGGGLWIGSGGSTLVANCTIVANIATNQNNGGIRVQSATPSIVNCILWDNEGPGGAQASNNQVNGTAAVTYSIVEGGFAGTGNLAGDPAFEDVGAGNYALTAASPAIDAGDNSGLPAGIVLDQARNARFVDDPAVPDTGSGSAPIVDIGAFERQAPAFVSYCTAGTSANGCQALLSGSGVPSATATSGFVLTASGVEGQKDGLFFFGTNGRQANSWGNGTSFQCVVPPVSRAGLLTGSGTTGLCDGSFAQDLNALWCPTCPKAAKNPGAGALVQAQLWYRDPTNTSNQTTSLSDGLEFTVQP